MSVAQLDRVFGYDPKGRGFESLQTHHLMEKYPSLVEGTGLENREVGDGAGVRIPLSPPF